MFTIPKRLRPYFRYQRALLGDLSGCAWRALRLWVLAYLEDEAAVPGAVGFIQTAGELLNWHPHVHLLVSDGVFDREGALERFTLFDTLLIERLFRAEVLRLLMDKGLISQDVVDNLLSWNHSGFSVHADVKVGDRQAAARLGRYMIRCPVVVERMSLDENSGEVLCRTRPSRADHPEGPVARWDVYELPTPSEIATDEPQGSGGRLFANPQSEGSRLSRCPVGDVDVHRSLHTLPNIGKGDDQKEPLVIHPRGDNRELGANVAVEERLDHASTTASNASVLVTGLVRQNLPDGAEFFSSLLGDELRSNGVARMYRRDSSTPSVALSVERKR